MTNLNVPCDNQTVNMTTLLYQCFKWSIQNKAQIHGLLLQFLMYFKFGAIDIPALSQCGWWSYLDAISSIVS